MSSADKPISVKVQTSNVLDRSRFNMSNNLSTSTEFGVDKPFWLHEMIPNSKETFQSNSLVRTTPMIAPPFGLINYETNHSFVKMSDLISNFDKFAAKQGWHVQSNVGSGDSKTSIFHLSLPSINLQRLSAMCLIGATAHAWYYSANNQITTAMILPI